MIPLIKVVSLLFRVFSKPLINYTKMYHATNEIKSNGLKVFFIMMGNRYNRFENFINKRYLKMGNFAHKPLNDNIAVEKGIQFFYEIIFYMIIIGFPVYELYVAAVQSQEKSSHMSDRLKSIQEKQLQLKEKIQKIIQLKKANEDVPQNVLKLNFQNLTQLKLSQGFSLPFGYTPIKSQYQNSPVKSFKYSIAS